MKWVDIREEMEQFINRKLVSIDRSFGGVLLVYWNGKSGPLAKGPLGGDGDGVEGKMYRTRAGGVDELLSFQNF